MPFWRLYVFQASNLVCDENSKTANVICIPSHSFKKITTNTTETLINYCPLLLKLGIFFRTDLCAVHIKQLVLACEEKLMGIPWCNCKLVTISFFEIPPLFLGFPDGASVKESTYQCRRCKRLRFNRWFNPWIGTIPWRRAWQPTLVLLPGESHGQRSSAGYSP